MNYRHAFHAGNFADVVKHIILTRLVEYLKKKDAAFRVIDTHAGLGRYDLGSSEAQRSPEWVDGIGRLVEAELPAKAKDLVAPYLDVIRAVKDNYNVPLFAYQVSGEYAMIEFAARAGAFDRKAAMLESLAAFKRAGCDGVLTYFALEAARELGR